MTYHQPERKHRSQHIDDFRLPEHEYCWLGWGIKPPCPSPGRNKMSRRRGDPEKKTDTFFRFVAMDEKNQKVCIPAISGAFLKIIMSEYDVGVSVFQSAGRTAPLLLCWLSRTCKWSVVFATVFFRFLMSIWIGRDMPEITVCIGSSSTFLDGRTMLQIPWSKKHVGKKGIVDW